MKRTVPPHEEMARGAMTLEYLLFSFWCGLLAMLLMRIVYAYIAAVMKVAIDGGRYDRGG